MWTVCNRCGVVFQVRREHITCNGCGREWCCEKCATYDGYAEHTNPQSCNYCRGEDYDDAELLMKALKLLGMSRKELINKDTDN